MPGVLLPDPPTTRRRSSTIEVLYELGRLMQRGEALGMRVEEERQAIEELTSMTLEERIAMKWWSREERRRSRRAEAASLCYRDVIAAHQLALTLLQQESDQVQAGLQRLKESLCVVSDEEE